MKIIAIDSSYGKNYSCTVFGYENEIQNLHDEFSLAMYGKKGRILHYSKTSNKIKKNAQRKIFQALQNTKVQFYIFEHKKPQQEERKNYYLTYIPNNITTCLHAKLMGRYGLIIVEADKDFEVTGVQNGTEKFVENFMFQLCFKLIGKPVKIRRESHELHSTVKFPNENKLNFIGRLSNRYNSKAIQLADIVLGYKLNNKIGLEKVVYRKI